MYLLMQRRNYLFIVGVWMYAYVKCMCISATSVHDSPGVHVFERTAELDEVLPHRSLWDKPPLLLKVL